MSIALTNMWEDAATIEEIRKIYAPTATQTEFKIFVELGKAANLNPFKKEIWCIKFKDSPAQIIIARDGYKKIAQLNPEYEWHQPCAIYENDKITMINGEIHHERANGNRGQLTGAYCLVKRKSSSRAMLAEVSMEEYNSGQGLWVQNPKTPWLKAKPETMIKKVAEAHALRMAFQDSFAGTYIEEEMESTQTTKALEGSTQTERLKNALKEPQTIDAEVEEAPKTYYSGRDDVQISPEQLDELSSLIREKGFSEERKNNALNYYKVSSLEELTDAQARLFLLQLGKA